MTPESAPSSRPSPLQNESEIPGEALDEVWPEATLELTNNGEKMRVDLFLCQELPGRSRSFIQKLINENWVTIVELPVSREVKSSTTVQAGSRVRVIFPPNRESALQPEDIPLQILYQDVDFAVVNKPADLVMHPSAHQTEGTLVNRLLHHLKDLSGIGGEERPGIVHRLDRNTSGVLVVAKNDLAHQSLSRQFKERLVKKTYVAVLRGECTAREGSIHLPIGRSITNHKRMMVRADGNGKEALTDYLIREEFDGYAFAEIRLHTGRTHQIRVHMAKIRLPVACDAVYGREQRIFPSDLTRRSKEKGEEPIIARQALHSWRICIEHPRTSKPLEFEAPPPDDMTDLLEALRHYRSL